MNVGGKRAFEKVKSAVVLREDDNFVVSRSVIDELKSFVYFVGRRYA